MRERGQSVLISMDDRTSESFAYCLFVRRDEDQEVNDATKYSLLRCFFNVQLPRGERERPL